MSLKTDGLYFPRRTSTLSQPNLSTNSRGWTHDVLRIVCFAYHLFCSSSRCDIQNYIVPIIKLFHRILNRSTLVNIFRFNSITPWLVQEYTFTKNLFFIILYRTEEEQPQVLALFFGLLQRLTKESFGNKLYKMIKNLPYFQYTSRQYCRVHPSSYIG